MNCAQIEILICDYAEGTLGAAEKAEVERHLAECPVCAELARDSVAALAFIERAAAVEPPPELITRILFDAPWSKTKTKSKFRAWLSALLSPIRQPKFAMGMALTVISLSMLAQFVVPVRQLQAGRFEAHGGVGRDGRPRRPHLGAHGEVLQQPEVCLPDSNHAAGMAAAGRKPAGAEQRGKPRERRPQAAGQLQSGKRTSSTRRHASSGPSGRFTLRDTL